jgi:hypothetical protein
MGNGGLDGAIHRVCKAPSRRWAMGDWTEQSIGFAKPHQDDGQWGIGRSNP